MKLLLVDNFDSFTYNLYHLLRGLGAELRVERNDSVLDASLDWCEALVLSPGPGLPATAGRCLELIRGSDGEKPLIGVCLGAQALAEAYGAGLYNQKEVAHGIQRPLKVHEAGRLFQGLPPTFPVGLYHSWAISLDGSFSSAFRPLAFRENGVLMAFEHRELPYYGLQFHPESIMTEYGSQIMRNALNL